MTRIRFAIKVSMLVPCSGHPKVHFETIEEGSLGEGGRGGGGGGVHVGSYELSDYQSCYVTQKYCTADNGPTSTSTSPFKAGFCEDNQQNTFFVTSMNPVIENHMNCVDLYLIEFPFSQQRTEKILAKGYLLQWKDTAENRTEWDRAK